MSSMNILRGIEKSSQSRCLLREQHFKNVWDALYTIPYGVSASYLDIAEKVGNTKAVRAIGGANSRNPISIIVPCHRVIGKSGKLVGYAGGLWRKEWLLKHEGILK